MSDSYQATYDAVRSRISNGDIGSAVESVLRNENIGFNFSQAAERIKEVAAEHERPFVLMRPKLFPDGAQWCALYGKNLQEGVAGFGETPHKAAMNFDTNWYGQTLGGEKS